MKAEGKGWHFKTEKGMEENTSDKWGVGDSKKFSSELGNIWHYIF